MSKPISYYDWERSFTKPKKKPQKYLHKKDHFPLGIPSNLYKNYLEQWKKENL
jgi:hypothetical protein